MIGEHKCQCKSSYHFPNSWWVRGGILLNTCHFKKLWRGQEDHRKPRTSELFDSETLKQFSANLFDVYQTQISRHVQCIFIVSSLENVKDVELNKYFFSSVPTTGSLTYFKIENVQTLTLASENCFENFPYAKKINFKNVNLKVYNPEKVH